MRKERSGDSVAYERFLRDLAAYLRHIVRYRLHNFGLNSDETEDVVQEVLIAIHTRRDQWNADRPLMPWLNAIVRYKVIDAARRLRKESRGRVDLEEEQWGSLPADDQNGVELSQGDIERLLSDLPAGQQSVARAMGIEGISASETAARLGMKENAVRVAFHRALQKLMATASGENNDTRERARDHAHR
ncbi:sigma-70 family RNA polymerase sigma factor [Bordetella muralis]|jgi:RNA polymerase sigma factor (sigma-70 family)|uniref:sigma-70 family RNA polymerase sigma factor n=1 Tax=Bordetella muralis TaxID=1649130 RepID=UPI0039F08D1C